MIDIHSHVLSGIDDGAKNLDVAIDMIKYAVSGNTHAIVATPHYRTGHYETSYDEILRHVDTLAQVIRKNHIKVDIYPGQEVFLDQHTVPLFKEGIIRGLNESRYMLVELPMDKFSDSYLDILYELRVLGVVPIVAHPERYRYVQEDIMVLNDFINEGCLFQLNAGSITGIMGKELAKTSKKLVQNGLCNFIASDAHNMNRRSTGLNQALEIVRKFDKYSALSVVENAQRMVMDEEIEQNRTISNRKGLFTIFDYI